MNNIDNRIKFDKDLLDKVGLGTNDRSDCLKDEINILDKTKIQQHKSHTLKFTHQYYTEKHNWTIYHSRIRKQLLVYINKPDMKYDKCSAPLKAFIAWDLKNRSSHKACYIARKCNPDGIDELEKINVSAVKKVNELTDQLKIKNKIKVMADAETITDKPKNNRYGDLEKYKKKVASTQTEYNPPFDEPDDISDVCFKIVNEFDLVDELMTKYDIEKYCKQSKGRHRFKINSIVNLCKIIKDPEDNDKLFKSLQLSCNRK